MEAAQSHNLTLPLSGLAVAVTLGLTPPCTGGLLDPQPLLVAALPFCVCSISL